MLPVIAQLIGFVGTALLISSFQFRSNQRFFLFQTLGSLCFTVHFFMLGAYSGMVLNVFCIFRGWVMMQSENGRGWARSRWMRTALLVLCAIATAVTWNGSWVILLPFIGTLVGTIAMELNNGKIIRLLQLGCVSPCWLTYNALCGSIPGVLTESFNMISVIVSICRFGLKNLGVKTHN